MKLQSEHIRKIAVFRALQLGDMLCSVPAFRALRNAFPEAHITLVGLPWGKSFVERFHAYFDSFVRFPGFPGLPEQPLIPKDFTGFLSRIQQEGFDLVLQMQGNGTIVNHMIELIDAKTYAGFCLEGHYCPNKEFFLPYPDNISEIERHLRLMEYLGIPSQGTQLDFPITDQDYQDFEKADLGLEPKKYVCIHPGSRSDARQWPPAYFAALGDYCAEQGLKVVITGVKDEQEIVSEVIKNMQREAINASGKTSLGAVGVLLKNALALIANSTGVSHIASALDTPSIIVSMDGEPERWGPLNKSLHKTIDWTQTPDFNLVFNETASLLEHLMVS